MQFIPNGTDIPDALLLAHEEGKVIFFCGVGIIYLAVDRLDLVNYIFKIGHYSYRLLVRLLSIVSVD